MNVSRVSIRCPTCGETLLTPNDGCTVLVSRGLFDDLLDLISAAHQEWECLRSRERAIAFADYR